MMGFGGMGMAIPWLFGAITLAAIWVGVWWLLTAIGMTAQHSHHHTPTQIAARVIAPNSQGMAMPIPPNPIIVGLPE